jgi:hypothetical protein
MKKRLALLLAAALLAQLLTVATFAEDTYVEVPQQPTEVTLEETEEPQPTEATEEEAAPEVTEAAPAEPVAEPAEEPAYEEAAPQVTEEVPAEDPAYEAESDAIEAEQYASNLASSYGDCYTRTLSSGETLRKGIDVSAYQGNINWKAVAASGIEFAIIRVQGQHRGCSGSRTQGRCLYLLPGHHHAGGHSGGPVRAGPHQRL